MTEETSRQINNGPGDSNDLMLIFLTWKLEKDFKIPVVSTKNVLSKQGSWSTTAGNAIEIFNNYSPMVK